MWLMSTFENENLKIIFFVSTFLDWYRRPAGVELCVFKLHDLFRKNVFIQVIKYRKNVCNTLCKTQKMCYTIFEQRARW